MAINIHSLDQPGTYWYHYHNRGQYSDGLRGPLITIHDPNNSYQNHFDEEIVLSVSDWYHVAMPGLITAFMAQTKSTGAEPVLRAALLTETQDFKLNVQPNSAYFIRIVNIGGLAGQHIWFKSHTMNIVNVKGVYTESADADMIYVSGT
ncbi:hypothetical protein S40293_08899 [Stachybotrys chartarum IBT 40293]|nr:hypothetical protein S40293_08899 [Stachybotrys chartarum IBT 40293]